MVLTEETIRAVLIAAIQAHGRGGEIKPLIEETVDALIAADRQLLKSTDNS